MNNPESSSSRTRPLGRAARLAVAVGLLAAGAAHAEGFYMGGQAGSPDYHSKINGVDGGGSGVGLKLYGGYDLSPNFSVEGGLFGLGHIDDATGRVRARGIYLDAVGHYPLSTQWSLVGSAGLAAARFDSSVAGDDDSPGLKLGAGVQYALSPQLALRAQYDRYHFTGAYDSKANIGQTTLGVRYAF